ncbi:MAG: HAMP domain-containing sensor histidine kinase [Candidatus Nanopelagicales bacterium]
MTAPAPVAGTPARRRRVSLTTRTVLVAVVVAVLAAAVAFAVSFPLVRASGEAQARASLARLADLTATSLQQLPSGVTVLPPRLAAVLEVEGVEAYLVRPGFPAPDGVTDADVLGLAAGQPVSTVADTPDGTVLVEGRPLGNSTGLVLLQQASVATEPSGTVLRRLAVALLIGLVFAVVVAVLASRRVTRPLRRAAEAANQLSTGRRDVRVEPEGPEEVAAIAESLNGLSAALAVSEGRQREFLLSVSHELRTPLTAVSGYAEALADGVVPETEVPRTGEVIRAEAARLDRLVADLLDLARLGAADFRVDLVDLDLALLAGEAAAVWADRCEREGVLLRVEQPGTPVPARTDPVRVRQVLDNLAENALRVTPAGRPIVLAVRTEGPWAVVEVRDGGPGLTGDDVGVAFEPGALYERYRGVRPVGTGLGLALVGRLAVGLGGGAEAGAAPEGGARFTVRVPGAPVAP